MLLDEFNKWCLTDQCTLLPYKETEDLFDVFYQNSITGRAFVEMLKDLAFEIYQLQVCVEGLIEEQ